MDKMIRIGIGGPVGAGKSHLVLRICEQLKNEYSIIVITNDIYTREDAQFLTSENALSDGRIMGVETGGCPHAAIRDDISLNANALKLLHSNFPDAQLALIESGGDNLSASFSPDLVDFQIYIIDVAQGDDIPRKGGIGISRSDLLIVNKTDLAEYVGANLDQMKKDLQAIRGPLPTFFCNLKKGEGLDAIIDWVKKLSLPEQKNTPEWAKKYNLQSGVVHHHHH